MRDISSLKMIINTIDFKSLLLYNPTKSEQMRIVQNAESYPEILNFEE